MGITRVNHVLLKNLTSDSNNKFGSIIDQNAPEHGSYLLPYRGNELIDWEVSMEPKIAANISINRPDHEVSRFELNAQNLSKSTSTGGRNYKREIILSLDIEKQKLLLNGKVCANAHLEDPRGWHCSKYHDGSLFSW